MLPYVLLTVNYGFVATQSLLSHGFTVSMRYLLMRESVRD